VIAAEIGRRCFRKSHQLECNSQQPRSPGSRDATFYGSFGAHSKEENVKVKGLALRFAVACTSIVLIGETFRIPYLELLPFFILFVSKEEKVTTAVSLVLVSGQENELSLGATIRWGCSCRLYHARESFVHTNVNSDFRRFFPEIETQCPIDHPFFRFRNPLALQEVL